MVVYAVVMSGGIVCSLWKNKKSAEAVVLDITKNWGRTAKVEEMKVGD